MQLSDLVYIDSTGYHFADYPSFLAWRIQQYQAIYGADVYLEPDSQDGQYLAILAKADYDTAAMGASAYNSFSPKTAQGIGLSRNVKINGLNRRSPTYSTVDLDIGGPDGTTITNGVAIDTLGHKWNLPASVTIISGGTISVTATAQLLGAIQAAAHTVNGIFTPTRGWQTVDNSGAASPGAPLETDAALRLRQGVSTSNPSLTVLDGTLGAVGNVVGVTAVRAYENDTGSADGNGIPAHSIAMVVQGGVSQDVANAIGVHKTPGTRTYGTTTEIFIDAHEMPINIHFYRPTPVTITCTVTLTANSAFTSDYEDLIKQTVADLVNNTFGIGNNVLITKFFSAAYLNGTPPGQSYDIDSLEIGKNLDPQSTINIPIAFNEIATCDPNTDVTIVVT